MPESRVQIADNGRVTVEDPDYELDAPLRLPASNVLEHDDGMPWFPGIGKKRNKDKILFVAACPLEEELSTMFTTKRQLLSGGPGNLFRRVALKAGVDIDEHNYTTLCKYPLARKKKLKPTANDIQRCKHLLEDELEKLQPRIVVCLGKIVFDYFFNLRLKEREIKGGWFRPKDRNFLLFVMDPLTLVFSKPEVLEAFSYDLVELASEYKYGNTSEDDIKQDYTLIEDVETLKDWVEIMRKEQRSTFSVDCEWAGTDYLSGKLRSAQFCWEKGKAVMLQFFDEYGTVAPYLLETAQTVLADFMNEPQIRFIGHNFSADAPWLEHHLGINTHKKCVFDTMYAMQTVDESYDQKLERLSIRFTTLGRYDIDLIIWKKENGDKMQDGGYGAIPTEILFPYACLRQDSLVELEDGSWEKIKTLVDTKYSGKVKAFKDGKIVYRNVTNWHKRNTKQKDWFKLKTLSTPSGRWGLLGPTFTPDHEVLTKSGKVAVENLVPGKDAILTDELEFNKEQISVLLASLLGDGGFEQRNNAKVAFRCGQCARRKTYVSWKASSLFPSEFSEDRVVPVAKCPHPFVKFVSRYQKQLVNILNAYEFKPTSENRAKKLRVTPKILEKLGPLGFAVWYQDDGVYKQDKRCKHGALGSPTISATTLDAQEQTIVVDYLKKTLNLRSTDIKYYVANKCIAFTGEARKKFLDWVHPFMHPDFNYKTYKPVLKPYKVDTTQKPYYEPIVDIIRVNRDRKGDGIRYCLSVEDAQNFYTKVGFVSNCADVDVPMRAMEKLLRLLAEDNTLLYYYNLCLPYVTDGFKHMHMTGVPLDREDTCTVRKNFQMVASLMLHEFKETVREKANNALLEVLMQTFPCDTARAVELYQDAVKTRSVEAIKIAIGAKLYATHHGILAHWEDAQDFNPNSSDQKQRWLFGFKGLEPIKSTKADGMPSVDWEKVKSLTPAEQRNYKPAVDKDVLQIYGVKDDDVKLLLEYLAVYQVIKNFLKTEGQGLEGFIREDGRVHTNFLMTETTRPKSLQPNILNIPAYLQDRVKNGFKRAVAMLCKTYNTDVPEEAYSCFLEERNEEERAELPDTLSDPVPLRWCFKAPPGWCFIDADYATAEVFALAYLSGDEELIAALTQPDPQFVLTQAPDQKEPAPVRVAFVEGVTQFSKEEWDEELLHNLDTLEHVLYNKDGSPQRPLRDVHWEMAENVQALNKPREKLRKALHRNGLGKVGNFCIAENQKVLTHKGPVNIQEITLDHLVWDGIEFVQHDGLTYNGYKKTISYYGLRGTPNHNVYDETGTCKRFGEIAAQQNKLFRVKRPGFKALVRAFRSTSRDSTSAWPEIITICKSYMQILWFDLAERFKKSRERLLHKMLMLVSVTKVQKPRNCKPSTQEKVYDILNAGPRHRYTVNGYLVSNSTPYGASPPLLERMVEVNTGEKPEPGTGERIIEAYRSTKPRAWEYLEWLRSLPETTGFYQAPCGAKRHFHIHSKEDVGGWKYKSILAGISREAANCAFQGLVAHTLARAIIWLIDRFKEEGLKAGVCIPLYDALYICCPIEERERVTALMRECMSEKNTWSLNGRELKFNLDFAVTKRWSCPPTEEELKELSTSKVA